MALTALLFFPPYTKNCIDPDANFLLRFALNVSAGRDSFQSEFVCHFRFLEVETGGLTGRKNSLVKVNLNFVQNNFDKLWIHSDWKINNKSRFELYIYILTTNIYIDYKEQGKS